MAAEAADSIPAAESVTPLVVRRTSESDATENSAAQTLASLRNKMESAVGVDASKSSSSSGVSAPLKRSAPPEVLPMKLKDAKRKVSSSAVNSERSKKVKGLETPAASSSDTAGQAVVERQQLEISFKNAALEEVMRIDREVHDTQQQLLLLDEQRKRVLARRDFLLQSKSSLMEVMNTADHPNAMLAYLAKHKTTQETARLMYATPLSSVS
eukprot:GILK01010333.1.p1 GENE.GILK01010333.1~~GILK01010333.1.p1  ORF type:complete len:244 (-),score=31.39 GILK01010333.1:214-849(-)